MTVAVIPLLTDSHEALELRWAAWKLRQVAPLLGALSSLADPVAEWLELESREASPSHGVAVRVAAAVRGEVA
jgi:hypothetical protein